MLPGGQPGRDGGVGPVGVVGGDVDAYGRQLSDPGVLDRGDHRLLLGGAESAAVQHRPEVVAVEPGPAVRGLGHSPLPGTVDQCRR